MCGLAFWLAHGDEGLLTSASPQEVRVDEAT